MAGRLEGKVAAVTGASSGIGAATAIALAGEGAAVGLAARRLDRIESLAKRIQDDGGHAVAIETDVTDEDSARAFVERTAEELDGLDVLVNNAGVMLIGPVQNADTETWRRMIHVNLLGLLYCTHAALPLLGNSGGGDVINVSSVAGRHANAGSAVYNMTKFGVHAFSEGLRQEAGGAGIRVGIVAPGFVATELQEQNVPAVKDQIDKMREKIGDVLQPEDIADAIVFAVTRPRHVALNEILVRPTGQSR